MSRDPPAEQQIAPHAQALTDREQHVGHRSLAFLLDQVAIGIAGLSVRDGLLVMAVNQANIAPLTRDVDARIRYGHLENPAPDAERRPVSVSAVACSLGLPFETVRRRVRSLEAEGVFVVTDQGVIVPETFLSSPAFLQTSVTAHVRLRTFYRDLRQQGLLGPLPPSAFDVADVVPVRGATRLLADYVLREADHLRSEAGDVVSAVILLAILVPSTAPPIGTRATPISALGQRLGMPTETVRRHTVHLVDQGLCVRTPAGLLVDREILARPRAIAWMRENAANVQRLFNGLAERGVVDAWARVDQGDAYDAPAFARALGYADAWPEGAPLWPRRR